jgi:hypothetical protein
LAEQTKNRKLFHVTVAKPYKQTFVAAQVMRIGDAYNPFFGFYEGSRVYPVTVQDGSVIQVPAVKFLKQVRAGNLHCSNLAAIAAEVASHYVMLSRELIMEEVRRDEFNSEPPSTQRCLYACDTLLEAQYWNNRIGDNGVICEVTCTGTFHRADAKLLLGDSEPLSVTKDRARAYWRGEAGNDPEWETLFVGDAKVTGVGL